MLIRRERDLEMDRNPLRHLLPNQNCKNLWNNIPDTCTYSTNVVLRAPGGAWDSDLSGSLYTSGCGPSQWGSSIYCCREMPEGRQSVWEARKRVDSQSPVCKALSIRLRVGGVPPQQCCRCHYGWDHTGCNEKILKPKAWFVCNHNNSLHFPFRCSELTQKEQLNSRIFKNIYILNWQWFSSSYRSDSQYSKNQRLPRNS